MNTRDPKSPGDAEYAWAAGRARLGLMLGPGSVLLAILVMLLIDLVDNTPSSFSDRWTASASTMWAGTAVFILHIASFTEFVTAVRVLRRDRFPVPVLGLALYWFVLAWPITWYVVQSAS